MKMPRKNFKPVAIHYSKLLKFPTEPLEKKYAPWREHIFCEISANAFRNT